MGLKENIIIGKLIPAGTGIKAYTDIEVQCDRPEPEEDELEDYMDPNSLADEDMEIDVELDEEDDVEEIDVDAVFSSDEDEETEE